jgi:hypothetical protein
MLSPPTTAAISKGAPSRIRLSMSMRWVTPSLIADFLSLSFLVKGPKS